MSLRLSTPDPLDHTELQSWLLKVDESTTVSEIAESLGVEVSLLSPERDGAIRLSEAGVLSGGVVPAPRAIELPAGTTRLEFIGGPFSGEIVPLLAGSTVKLGRDPESDICIADPYLLPQHATITLQGGVIENGKAEPLSATIVPFAAEGASAASVILNGVPSDGSVSVVPADLVQLGSSIVRIGITPGSDADIAVDALGNRAFNRPSRIKPLPSRPVVQLPGEKPQELDASPLPWLSALVPVVLGVTLAIVFARPMMLLMAAASPIMVIGSFITNRKLAKRKGQRTEGEWIAEINTARERIASLVREQRLDHWYRQLDPVVVRDIALRPLSRLWERRRGDADALRVRIGVTDVPLEANFEGGAAKERSQPRRAGVSPAPVAIDLAEGPAGLAGSNDVVRGLARSVICSLSTLRSPRDLQLVVLCDSEQGDDWGWVQWMPHAHAGANAVALMGNTELTRRERVREVSSLLEARMRASGERSASFDTQVVLVIDGARRYRMLPGMVAVLEKGARYGIHVIALESDRSRLPEECASLVTVDASDPTLGHIESSADYHATVLLDGVTTVYAEAIARSLCSIEHVRGAGDDSTLPASVRFTELLGIDLDDPQPIVEQWRVAPRQSFVVVGAGAEGEFAIDIAKDGPHALVAGTTGSGKSEFLQALVVSLAMSNRPDALNFVLVDYKGGSAFSDCARLPHTVGTVTNLDARETERALASLDAELKRRERVLRDDIGAKDADAAWLKDPEASARLGLARLMIVVDEFAELKAELPEFITGLVRIARVGRSLGVHLVLATQRPSGVITPEMQSNINLRVALRVTDRADSTDIIGTGDAALIASSSPGRGFVRAGQDASPLPFQTARVAGLRLGHQRVARVLPPSAPIEWATLGLPARYPSVSTMASHRPDQDDTDLRALVNVISSAATMLGIKRSASPWLLPLPEVLSLDRFDSNAAPAGSLILGLEDVPSEQSQRPLLWSVTDDSHLLFIGGSLSGRTTALRSLLAQAIQRFTPAELHLYVADYGNGALLPLAAAPHTGAVVTALDSGRLTRLLSSLIDELSRRQTVLSQASLGSIGEQRAASDSREALPYAIFAVDGWERLTATLPADELIVAREQILRLLREGPAAGIRVVVSADRSVTSDRIASFIDTQYALRMRDVNDYRAAGIMVREIAPEMPAGRVLFGASGNEAQLAIVGSDTSSERQNAVLRGIVEHISAHFAAFPQLDELPQPTRIDPLPSYIELSAAFVLPKADARMPEQPVFGVGGDQLSRYTLDWPELGGFVVCGDRRSGKSQTLALIAHQLAWAKTPLVVVAAAGSPLAEVAKAHSVPVLDASSTQEQWSPVLAPIDGLLTVIVDDAERWKDSLLEMALTGARGHSRFIVSIGADAASSVFSGAYAEAKKARTGLLLSATTSILGTQVFGTQLPRHLVGRAAPGGGAFYSEGHYLAIQVPDLRA